MTTSILIVGDTGSGKTTQILTLPGRKFVYVFDPNALASLKKADPDNTTLSTWLPRVASTDFTLHRFTADAKRKHGSADKQGTAAQEEPMLYNDWAEHFNKTHSEDGFSTYDWICLDSLTFLSRALMDRVLFINDRSGRSEEPADFKIVGAQLANIITGILGMGLNVYATGHKSVYTDEKTSKVTQELFLPGRARTYLPISFDNVWEAHTAQGKEGLEYMIRTVPDTRGLQKLRCSLDIPADISVTIPDLRSPKGGIGAILSQHE